MDNQLGQQTVPDQQLCTECRTFYAHPQLVSLCSQCFKVFASDREEALRPDTVAVQEDNELPPVTRDAVTHSETGLCRHCGKKMGVGVFNCRCEQSFCRKHRLPESHNCNFDFRSEGKKFLAKLNPRVEASKLERI